jgi:hypothetical protein
MLDTNTRGVDIMVAAGGINLYVQPLTRLEYFEKQENP